MPQVQTPEKTITTGNSARILGERTFKVANLTPEQSLLDAQCAKSPIRPTSRSLQSRASAVIAAIARGVARVQRIHLVFEHPVLFLKTLYFKTKRFGLGLKIAILAFHCRLLGLDEPKVLTEDRRRAVFVDQFFKKLKQSHDDLHSRALKGDCHPVQGGVTPQEVVVKWPGTGITVVEPLDWSVFGDRAVILHPDPAYSKEQ